MVFSHREESHRRTWSKLLRICASSSWYITSVRIIDLVSHTTYVVFVNFIHKWRHLQFKVDSARQIFWKTFHGNFIYRFFARNLLRKLPKKYFSYFVLMSGLGLDPGFLSTRPWWSQYSLWTFINFLSRYFSSFSFVKNRKSFHCVVTTTKKVNNVDFLLFKCLNYLVLFIFLKYANV